MANEKDDSVYIADDCNGSRTIAYKNDDSIHLVGDNEKSAYCCKYDNSDSSIICTATKCGELTETSSFQGTAKMSFLRVLVMMHNVLRL